jgi:hypothetical protein
LIELETKFWQSMLDRDTDAALQLLHDPSQMATAHGAMKFDHAGYRKMAEQGSMVVTSFELSNVKVAFPNDTTAVLTYQVKRTVTARDSGKSKTLSMSNTSTWIHAGQRWQCVLHTESPTEAKPAK